MTRHSTGNIPLVFLIALILGRVLFCPASGSADIPDDPRTVSWHLSADKISHDRGPDTYLAEGNVVIAGGKTRLEADRVEFSNQTMDAAAAGNVRLISGEDVISCDVMEINLLTEQGHIHKGTLYIQKNNFYIEGEHIRKTGKFSYSAETGSITSCPGDIPDWKISGKNITVTVEGYGIANHATLWARNLPVLYTPFLTFPVKTRRQSGLLTPRIATSDRLGFEYEQPVYWAISDNTDATLYADILSERGNRMTGEFRYLRPGGSRGIWRLDYLDDTAEDDGTDATKNFRFDTTPQRQNTDRYWLRMMTDQQLPYAFTAKLDIDLVSDADYLLEFQDGLTGFHDTNQLFRREFGRDLDEYDNTLRRNSLTLDRSGPASFFSARTQWNDDVIARRGDGPDTTLQTLPAFEYYATQQPLGQSGLYMAFDSRWHSFYRQDTRNTALNNRFDALVSGQRADLHPRLYYPVKLGQGVSFQPFIGARATAYHTRDYTDIYQNNDPFRTRQMMDTGATLSTGLERIFTPGMDFADRLRHRIEPQLQYHYIPHRRQNDLPYFDPLDDIAADNRITWSLTQTLTSRRTITDPRQETFRNQYQELAWFRVFQDYHLDPDPGYGIEKQTWSDIYIDSEFRPFSHLSLDADMAWSPDTSHVTELNLDATLSDYRGDAVSTAYRYRLDLTESWQTRFLARFTSALAAYHAFEIDLAGKNTIETRTGILVNRDCWDLGLEFMEASGDNRISFMITLRGIGEFGNQ